jgi:hypothetical protein
VRRIRAGFLTALSARRGRKASEARPISTNDPGQSQKPTFKNNLGGQGSSAYSEGGALYAYGLIHGNHYQEDVETYLLEKLRASSASEVLQHGACLGLGLSSMGTHSARVAEEMKQVQKMI